MPSDDGKSATQIAGGRAYDQFAGTTPMEVFVSPQGQFMKSKDWPKILATNERAGAKITELGGTAFATDELMGVGGILEKRHVQALVLLEGVSHVSVKEIRPDSPYERRMTIDGTITNDEPAKTQKRNFGQRALGAVQSLLRLTA